MVDRIPAHALQPGDVVTSGETVVSVRSAGIDLPPRKASIVLEKNGHWRRAVWGKHTLIGVHDRRTLGELIWRDGGNSP